MSSESLRTHADEEYAKALAIVNRLREERDAYRDDLQQMRMAALALARAIKACGGPEAWRAQALMIASSIPAPVEATKR